MAEHPDIAWRIGDETIATSRVECALYALAVLRGADEAMTAEHDLAAMLRHLTVPGAQARWLTRFSPVAAAHSKPGTCSPYP